MHNFPSIIVFVPVLHISSLWAAVAVAQWRAYDYHHECYMCNMNE